MATKKTPKSTPSWSDVKTKLADFDRAGLMGLVQDLYAASKDNQAFLHARFGLGEDVLKPYKAAIDREREAVLDQLVGEAQEQDMGYGRP